MKLSVIFRERLAGFLQPVVDELDNDYGVIQTWSAAEHNDDGTHMPNVGNLVQAVAGMGISQGQSVYVAAGADQRGAGQAYLTDATSATKSTQAAFIGFATANAQAGQNVVCRYDGIMSGFAGLTPGFAYYLSTIAGSITSVKPTNAVLVGMAISTTQLLLIRAVPTTIAGQATMTWSGAASGSANVAAAGTVNFTTTGVYTFTVANTVTMKIKIVGGGAAGGDAGPLDQDNGGGGGGGGGASNTTGLNQQFVPGTTYEMRVGTGGVGAGVAGQSSYVKIQGSTVYVEAGGGTGGNNGTLGSAGTGGAGGTMITGAGTTGGIGGNGGATGGGTGNNGGTGPAGGGGGGGGHNGGGTGGTGGNGGNGGGSGSPSGGSGRGGNGGTGGNANLGTISGGGGGQGHGGGAGGGAGNGQNGAVAFVFVSEP